MFIAGRHGCRFRAHHPARRDEGSAGLEAGLAHQGLPLRAVRAAVGPVQREDGQVRSFVAQQLGEPGGHAEGAGAQLDAAGAGPAAGQGRGEPVRNRYLQIELIQGPTREKVPDDGTVSLCLAERQDSLPRPVERAFASALRRFASKRARYRSSIFASRSC